MSESLKQAVGDEFELRRLREFRLAICRVLDMGDEPDVYIILRLVEAVKAVREAVELIEKIGTTGVERTDIIRRADEWIKLHGISQSKS